LKIYKKIDISFYWKGKMWYELPYGIFMKVYELDGVKHRFTLDTTNGKRSPIEKLVENKWKRI